MWIQISYGIDFMYFCDDEQTIWMLNGIHEIISTGGMAINDQQ